MSTTLKSTEDISDPEKRLKSLQSGVTLIKDLSDEQLKLKRVSDLIMACEKMSRGIILIISSRDIKNAQRELKQRVSLLREILCIAIIEVKVYS